MRTCCNPRPSMIGQDASCPRRKRLQVPEKIVWVGNTQNGQGHSPGPIVGGTGEEPDVPPVVVPPVIPPVNPPPPPELGICTEYLAGRTVSYPTLCSAIGFDWSVVLGPTSHRDIVDSFRLWDYFPFQIFHDGICPLGARDNPRAYPSSELIIGPYDFDVKVVALTDLIADDVIRVNEVAIDPNAEAPHTILANTILCIISAGGTAKIRVYETHGAFTWAEGWVGVKKVDNFSCPNTPCSSENFDTIEVPVSGNIKVWFGSGDDFPAGNYVVEYRLGALKYHSTFDWALNASETSAFYIFLNDGNTSVKGPATDGASFPSQALLEAHNAGATVGFYHTGGKIGMALIDSPYSDNVEGSPNPSFRLAKVCTNYHIPPPVLECGSISPTIESLMRTVQERRFIAVGTFLSWPDRTILGTENPALPLFPAPEYPPDGFYDNEPNRYYFAQAVWDAFSDSWLNKYATTGDWDGLDRIPVFYISTPGDFGANFTAATKLELDVVTEENLNAALRTMQAHCCAFQWLAVQAEDDVEECEAKETPGVSFFTVTEARGYAEDTFESMSWSAASAGSLQNFESTSSGLSLVSAGFVAIRGKFNFLISRVKDGAGAVFYRTNTISGTPSQLSSSPTGVADGLFHVGTDTPLLDLSDFLTGQYGNQEAMNFELPVPDNPPQSPQVDANGGWVCSKPVARVFKSSSRLLGHWVYYP